MVGLPTLDRVTQHRLERQLNYLNEARGKIQRVFDDARSRLARQFPTAEDVVKPGLSDEVLQRLALLRPPVDQGVAEIRWGKASKFRIAEPEQPTEINYTTIINTGDGTDDPPPGAEVLYFDEYQRQEETIRVENPDDPEQYVMVRRLQWIAFQGRTDGIFRVFTFTNPDAG